MKIFKLIRTLLSIVILLSVAGYFIYQKTADDPMPFDQLIRKIFGQQDPLEEYIDKGRKVEIKSTEITKDYFPAEITKAWILKDAKEISASSASCRSITPLNAWLGNYTVPEEYRKGLSSYKKTDVTIMISVYENAKHARQSADNCGNVIFRGPYWVDINLDYTTGSAGIPRSAIYTVDNYLVHIPTQIGGWTELTVKEKIVPAFKEQIRLQY